MTAPYVTGTVSVTAGSAVVTGSGTAWATALIAGGLFGLDSSSGNPVPILSVDSNTQLTLAKPWRGTTAAGQAYWIIRDTAYLQQLSANAQALATYIQRLDSASLAALASLVPAADKLAYFTGANTAVLTDIKAKGRDVLAADTMLSLLAKLGPVNGGNPSPTPAGAGVGLIDGDFNSVVLPGVYTISGQWANGFGGAAPTSYTAILIVYARFSQVFQEIWMATAGSPNRWTRWTATNNGSWPNPWIRLPGEFVGTVSQSGGIPTGAILERGNNANGQYTKWADGTMICAGQLELAAAQAPAAGNYLFPITFPATFSTAETIPRLVAVPGYSAAGTPSFINTVRWGLDRFPSATGGGVVIQMAASIGTTIQFNWVAYGRWF
ncbi:phage tail protein [Sinorhizobium meliloti]|uniref:phage tail protein n=1 Tax=Rhizobium meliloti TaxID=382 RepID=UPI002090D834|nr:phage tail protein [Sinorhizobium meliloti]MCO5962373.1 phage tail protein [Sinorhizobium meliloti]